MFELSHSRQYLPRKGTETLAAFANQYDVPI